ncbi:MAG: DNA repair protein RecN [Candidatus Dormibacteraeota bacterium]|nr:DNA repair protein RecN [Candidatus Dormibacteraeota bacterium]
MILELTIRNLALIDELRVPFRPGLNLLTGETGSGKSIIIDAMNLVLGERASADAIREGREQAFIEAAFEVGGRPALRLALEAAGYECPDGVIILTRELNRNGRTLSRINGRLSTVTQLKGIGDRLVEMHGQHEHQSVLLPARQRDLLDAFGGAGLRALRDQVGAAHARWSRSRSSLAETEAAVQADQRELDFWRFQLDEIEAIRPDPAEEEALLQERRRAQHAERLARAVEGVHALDADEASAVHALSIAAERFRGLEGIDPDLDQMSDLLNQVLLQLRELATTARDQADRWQIEPARLEAIEVRLHQLDRLKAKYGGSLTATLEEAARLRDRLDTVEHRDDRIAALRAELNQLTASLAVAAGELSRQRRKAAAKLERILERELAGLNMPRVRFAVRVNQQDDAEGLPIDDRPVHSTPTGVDQVAFLLAANPGEPLLALDRAASGGELSRVMLALKAVLADADETPTLILDEIDTGIGGETASRLAEKMAALSRGKQVICVTHLAAIAARADHHLAVAKSLQRGRHVTGIKVLQPAERVDEVARLIAGERVTPAARASARELLARG